MAYTEIKNINGNKYYYRVISIRNGDKISKKRIYLGSKLSNLELSKKEKEADKELLLGKIDKVNKEIERIKPKIIKILKKNKIKRAGIFGSYSRGEQKNKSDIDILVEPPKNIGFRFFGIQLELEEKLGKKVDLVSYNGLSPYLRDRILNEEIRILWKKET